MVDQNCAYCVEGELLAKFGIKICELENSKVYLFKEQSHPGRVVVAHKKHVSEILELTPQERAAYLEEIAKVYRRNDCADGIRIIKESMASSICHNH